ncbi:MAG: phage tail assembly protein [Clostridia bacterium]|nr:phage tail assembly protein [Clostridia bacterium]
MSDLKTIFPFELKKGIVLNDSRVLKKGKMRLATAGDEIVPLKDPRVQANPAYLIIILLSRVIIEIEGIEEIDTRLIENLFVEDLAYLQDFYNRINGSGSTLLKVTCPHCDKNFHVEPESLGEL